MPLPPANVPLPESDYEVIEAAVMETARGRWFLSEYAERNRNADTRLVLEAIQRLQRSVLGVEAAPETQGLRSDLGAMEKTIERTKRELAGVAAARRRDGDIAGELREIVTATAQAIGEILADTERVQEIAWTMREQGVMPSVCDQLDGLATHIYTACAFQDLTGQRVTKIISALRLLEERVQGLVKLWQVDGSADAAPVQPNKLLNGPARAGGGLRQDQVDELLAIDKYHDVFWDDEDRASAISPVPARAPAIPVPATSAPSAAAPVARAATRADIEKLSTEERIAMFS